MYLILLLFGALLAAAGVILTASGVSIHDHVFDAATATPGLVAVIGGVVIFGLGLALRLLHRIELSLATRPMPRTARMNEPALASGMTSEAPPEAPRVPLPPRTPMRAAPPATGEPAEHVAGEDTPAKRLERIARFDNTRSAAESDSALRLRTLTPKSHTPAVSARGGEESAEPAELRSAARLNGTGTTRLTPRLDLNTRAAPPGEREKGPLFDALWTAKGPKGTPLRPVQPAEAPIAAAEPAREPAAGLPPAPVLTPEDISGAVTVLKSGVVDGMAYTLFSDGSIEAELPQGTLRFGSINELRNHIEQSA